MKEAEILLNGQKYLVKNLNNANVSIFTLDENTKKPVEIGKGSCLWCACRDWFVNTANQANVEQLVADIVEHLNEDISDDPLTAMYQIDNFLDGLTGEEFFKKLRLHHDQFYVIWNEVGYDKVS
jgi:hypothetical protein